MINEKWDAQDLSIMSYFAKCNAFRKRYYSEFKTCQIIWNKRKLYSSELYEKFLKIMNSLTILGLYNILKIYFCFLIYIITSIFYFIYTWKDFAKVFKNLYRYWK